MTLQSNKLKARIRELGLTQKEVAQGVHMNLSTFNRKINDESGTKLKVSEAKALVRFLRIKNPLEYFF